MQVLCWGNRGYKFTLEHNILTYNCSITITVKEDEWEDVEDWCWVNWDCVVGISFLSIDTKTYPLMPYQEITEEEFTEKMSKLKHFDPELLKQFEQQQEEFDDVDVSECSTGACPIR